MTTLFVGILSGTSGDGIDAALVAFDDDGRPSPRLAITCPYPDTLRADLERTVRAQTCTLDALARLDSAVADAFADAVKVLLDAADVGRAAVSAIGSHGQTIGHFPGDHGNTLQIGDPNRIAAATGIPVVADFRRADMAVGGQGAPLAPLFHAYLFGASNAPCAILNLGGIANLTVIDTDGAASGFDVGPANTLLDGWAQRHGRGPHDEGGAFARSGQVDAALLKALLQDPYFALPPPKSTGREYFSNAWLDRHLAGVEIDAADVQATLAELTAATIAEALSAHANGVARVFACGGGIHNTDLVHRIAARADVAVDSTRALGIDPDFVEAMLFAWLARERIFARSPEGLDSVTGARARAVLGGVWLPPRSL